MSVEIKLPQLGFTMSEGVLSQWLVADGASVTAGSPIYTLEAEKAVEEVEAPASGVIRIIAKAGETYSVGTILATIA